ncbi:DUF3164 family protein [Capnocytophaga stomatis]|uniref:DUF3164 family protein n=1 Tax=Capnocytophaga stomatis TaxID=1848904 RepID=UPI001AC1EF34|nr:DUF3164 family protein [Capnocytophaga stomatis]GIM49439.1 hypothetical protein CAPN003_08910 [Capnocytophaga stomatis]
MSNIDLSQLSDEQRNELIKQAKELAKKEREQRAQDLKALEELASETVPSSFELLRNASQILTQAKTQIFRNFENFLRMKIERMGIKAKKQQSHTITFKNQSIKLGYRVTDGYTDEVGYGLEMVHKFLGSLSKDEDTTKLVNSIYRLLQRNNKGDLDSKKVLLLKQIADKDFPDTELQKGVEIIQNAYKPKLSKWYIEAWEVNGVGIEQSLPLSITSAQLPNDIDLTFLLPEFDEN